MFFGESAVNVMSHVGIIRAHSFLCGISAQWAPINKSGRFFFISLSVGYIFSLSPLGIKDTTWPTISVTNSLFCLAWKRHDMLLVVRFNLIARIHPLTRLMSRKNIHTHTYITILDTNIYHQYRSHNS